ncbi:TPA: TM2 domain-containing protein [Streptococcus suis]|nr:TM2 domain-containing protein [Streptococcus suis]MCQ8264358.1 TM2 domain-containing protein [Streptococcus suis]HEL9645106.1 TM2 domain-containing protein [Streptococcus suis]
MSQFTDSYLAANASNLPAESLPMLRQRLDELDESQTAFILATELKSPTTALIFSILLGSFGADRFYIGQIGLGVAKLLLSWLTFGIWVLVDWFLIMGATKKANLEKLNMALMTAKMGR